MCSCTDGKVSPSCPTHGHLTVPWQSKCAICGEPLWKHAFRPDPSGSVVMDGVRGRRGCPNLDVKHSGQFDKLANSPISKTESYKFLPLNDALQVMCFPVLVEMVRYAAEGRCMICGWSLAPTVHRGCVPGNCSYRPDPDSREYPRWRQRTEVVLYALAGEVTNPAPRDPAGDCAREFAEANGAPARTGEPGSAQWAGAEEKSSNAEDVRNAATGEL